MSEDSRRRSENNDLMDPHFKPSEPKEFEAAWIQYYRALPGVPNTVETRNFCQEFFEKKIDHLQSKIKTLESEVNELNIQVRALST